MQRPARDRNRIEGVEQIHLLINTNHEKRGDGGWGGGCLGVLAETREVVVGHPVPVRPRVPLFPLLVYGFEFGVEDGGLRF